MVSLLDYGYLASTAKSAMWPGSFVPLKGFTYLCEVWNVKAAN